MVSEGFSDFFACRAYIYEQRCVVRDIGSNELRNSRFLFERHDLTGRIRDVLNARKQTGTAVKSLKQRTIAQLIDISTDGLRRNAKEL